MYKIIGANQTEYGPVSADQLREWIAEGRADANTRARLEGTEEWKPLRDFPEFAANFTAASGPPPPLFTGGQAFTPTDGRAQALNEINGPATGLMVVACLGFALSILGLLASLVGAGLGSMNMANFGPGNSFGQWGWIFSGVAGVILRLVSLAICGYVFYGAQNMKKLQNHPLCLGAAICAMLPCLSPCCLLGLPIGIWALVVLNQPQVREQFT